LASNFKKSEFQNIVKKAKEYIKKGDIIQVVLSQRFKVKMDKEPFDIYRALRSLVFFKIKRADFGRVFA